MHHTSECAGRIDFEGEALFEVRNRYYEVEFPDAAMILTLYVKVTDDAFEARVWQQHYPGGRAEWLRTDDVYPRRLATMRRFADEHFEEIEPNISVLDSCGERKIECIRQLDATPQSLKELLIDLDGRARLLRHYRADEGGDVQVGDWRYTPSYDEVPDDLVFAVWAR